MEEKHIPEDIDYEDVKNLALEAKQNYQKLDHLPLVKLLVYQESILQIFQFY